MSSTMVFDRAQFAQSAGAPASAPAPTPGFCAIPICDIQFEKCKGGFKIHCKCDDEIACATLQNLCRSLAGGLCCCICTWNGMTVCQCNLCCGNCKCEYTPDGVCVTCTSGDAQCCAMIQCCCDALACCAKSGCCCTISFGVTAVCCCVC